MKHSVLLSTCFQIKDFETSHHLKTMTTCCFVHFLPNSLYFRVASDSSDNAEYIPSPSSPFYSPFDGPELLTQVEIRSHIRTLENWKTTKLFQWIC